MAKDDDEDDRRGLSDIAHSLLGHGSEYIDARLELARLETDEAAEHFRGLSIRLGVGVFAAITGYTMCLLAGIALLAQHLSNGDWALLAIVAGGLHLTVGALFLAGARRQARLSSELFGTTRRELIKDQLWLKQKSQASRDADAPN